MILIHDVFDIKSYYFSIDIFIFNFLNLSATNLQLVAIDWKCYRYYDNVQIFENQTIMRPLVPKTLLFLGHPALYIYIY